MAKIDVTLAGQTYQVPRLNIGQIERVTDVFNGPRDKVPYQVLRIAFERVDGKPSVDEMEPDGPAEIARACQAILEGSGFKPPEGTSGDPLPA